MKLLKQKLFPRRAQPVMIGRFNVLRLLGHGGMGAVYACYDEALDRKIAVKILHLESSRDRELASARLVREGQALARLSHPNVVTVHEVGRSDEEVFIAMEFLRGDSLDVWVAQPRS
ncbi:MAG: protein kinase domain-containing protein, partial [Nannocystaceae bacterium]